MKAEEGTASDGGREESSTRMAASTRGNFERESVGAREG